MIVEPGREDGARKSATKDKLRDAAMRELNVSRNSFDYAWIDDWYEPLRQRFRTKS
jgi:hypothetical protein